MSRFFTPTLAALEPYTPGEQLAVPGLVKLNANENPYPPAPGVAAAVAGTIEGLRLYSDLTEAKLTAAIAARCGVPPQWVLCGNGSDENLLLAIRAFCDQNTPLAFADITYSFYPRFVQPAGRARACAAAAGGFHARRGRLRCPWRDHRACQPQRADKPADAGRGDRAHRAAQPGPPRHCGRGVCRLCRAGGVLPAAGGKIRKPDGGAHLLQIPQPGGRTAGVLCGAAGADRRHEPRQVQLQPLQHKLDERGRRGRRHGGRGVLPKNRGGYLPNPRRNDGRAAAARVHGAGFGHEFCLCRPTRSTKPPPCAAPCGSRTSLCGISPPRASRTGCASPSAPRRRCSGSSPRWMRRWGEGMEAKKTGAPSSTAENV